MLYTGNSKMYQVFVTVIWLPGDSLIHDVSWFYTRTRERNISAAQTTPCLDFARDKDSLSYNNIKRKKRRFPCLSIVTFLSFPVSFFVYTDFFFRRRDVFVLRRIRAFFIVLESLFLNPYGPVRKFHRNELLRLLYCCNHVRTSHHTWYIHVGYHGLHILFQFTAVAVATLGVRVNRPIYAGERSRTREDPFACTAAVCYNFIITRARYIIY